jgi:hypothetical protein
MKDNWPLVFWDAIGNVFGCIGYLGHPFVKEAPWAFTARLFFVVRWHSAIVIAGEWFSWIRENRCGWAAGHQGRHAQAA